MATGPTQNYGDAASTTWRPRPVLATLVRATASVGPLLFAVVVGAGAARWVPPARLGVPGVVWLLLVVALSSGVLIACSRWLRRLVPLSALLRLSLVLPDRVPSRFEVARRTWSPAALEPAAGAEGDADGSTGAAAEADRGSAERLLALVSTLAAHDARTRAHGERVQAYAALIGHELGLPREDVDRLSWAALLHDVGKVHVPVEVINKNGRPTEQEWAALQQHPCHGGRLVQPLRAWLGPWLDGVEQHHERWDGGGYPQGLAGEQVSLAARVIAVADTYDVITSARAYKKPMSAEQARAEITRCAGSQFDPEVVRAFLAVGIGRLRLIAGPATLLAALPGVGSAPAQALSSASALAQTAGGQVLSVLLSAGVGVGAGLTGTQALAASTAPASAVAQQAAAAAQPVDTADAVPPRSPATSAPPTTSTTPPGPPVPTAQAPDPADPTTGTGTEAGTAGTTRTLGRSGLGTTRTSAPPSTATRTPAPSPARTPTTGPTTAPATTAPATTAPAPTGSPAVPTTPTAVPTATPTGSPTAAPTGSPTAAPTGSPTAAPTGSPTGTPTATPTGTAPSAPAPTATPTGSANPTAAPAPPTGGGSTATPAPTCTGRGNGSANGDGDGNGGGHGQGNC